MLRKSYETALASAYGLCLERDGAWYGGNKVKLLEVMELNLPNLLQKEIFSVQKTLDGCKGSLKSILDAQRAILAIAR